MKSAQRTMRLGVGAAVLWATLATGVQGYSAARGPAGAGLGPTWVHLRGHVLCAGCTLEDLRATPPVSPARLYQLTHRRGPVVLHVRPEGATLPYRRLWLKGGDQVFETLTAEETLFREVEVAGLLREYLPTAGTLDLASVRVLGAKPQPR